MFVEFESDILEQWNNLSKEQKEKALKNDEVQIAVNVDIKIESHHKILEEHKYYQVINQSKLLNDVWISNVNEQETTFLIDTYKNNGEKELIYVKTNEEKTIEIGAHKLYTRIYRIKVTNIKYGNVVEL